MPTILQGAGSPTPDPRYAKRPKFQVSVRGASYDRYKLAAAARGITVAELVDQALAGVLP